MMINVMEGDFKERLMSVSHWTCGSTGHCTEHIFAKSIKLGIYIGVEAGPDN